jgi:DNA-binding LacI/PurR family transcriptional regulator
MRLIDIARQAHVSPATVSRALNQPEIVSAEALARIEAVMRAHHYVPAPASRRRGPQNREPRIHRLGVWFVDAAANNPSLNWFQDQLLQIQASNPRYQVDLKLIFSPSHSEFPRVLKQEKVDGVILQGMEPTPEILACLRPLPYVWFMTRRSLAFADDYVEPNNEENGRLAAHHLHERGHRNVAVISIDPDYTASPRRWYALIPAFGLGPTNTAATCLPRGPSSLARQGRGGVLRAGASGGAPGNSARATRPLRRFFLPSTLPHDDRRHLAACRLSHAYPRRLSAFDLTTE